MSEERPIAISSSSHVSAEVVATRSFPTVRRGGFDAAQVRAYLEEIAGVLSAQTAREEELRAALADAERRAANPVLDEATLTNALGHETARVLQTAHDAAREMVAKAHAEAEQMLASARDEISETEERTQALLKERATQAEHAAAELRRRAEEEAAAAIEAARSEVEGMITQARTECRDMLEEAQSLRARVLGDLSKRRKVLHAQIEQLRAGRERLAETVRGVRLSIDTIADELFRADDAARLAAEAAGREAAERGVAEPDVAERGVAEPDGKEPDVAERGVAEPDVAERGVA
ncbi:MAG: DivIVA domain-containing protein, partial [Actinomycetota bacterium]|nr:DivIVA domain-containing protein [Actinomycetota bacterium]